MTVVRFSRPYGTRAIGSHFESQDPVLGYVQTVPTARRDPVDSVTDLLESRGALAWFQDLCRTVILPEDSAFRFLGCALCHA